MLLSITLVIPEWLEFVFSMPHWVSSLLFFVGVLGATLHGRGSVVYMSDGTNAAEKITEAAEWSIDVDFDEEPDPAVGDTWETRLKGLFRWSGALSGNFDDAQDTLWKAATATTTAKFYLYPDSAQTGRYYYGNIWPKLSVDGSVTSKENFSVTFEGSGQLAKNPA